MSKTYHIFISHSWKYSDAYEKLIHLLDNAEDFAYCDYSVPEDDPIEDAKTDKQLEAAIKEQMAHASVVLVLAGVYSSYSKWINKEIDYCTSIYHSKFHRLSGSADPDDRETIGNRSTAVHGTPRDACQCTMRSKCRRSDHPPAHVPPHIAPDVPAARLSRPAGNYRSVLSSPCLPLPGLISSAPSRS